MKSERKKLKPFDWVIIVAFISFVVVTPVWMIKNARVERFQQANMIESLFANISFSGKVVGIHTVKHLGMPSAAIMCIKIDSSNLDSFYKFDKYTALKIENGIATFPIGGYDKSTDDTLYEKVVYVNINEAKSHKMIFVSNQNDTIEHELCYTSVNLKENDMGICDSCH